MKSYNDIMQEFEGKFSDCPEIPQSLSKESIVNKIKNENVTQESRKSFEFKWEALAAVFAVIIVAGVILMQQAYKNDSLIIDGHAQNSQSQLVAPTSSATVKDEILTENNLPEGVYNFKSSESLRQYIVENYRNNYYIDGYINESAQVTLAVTTTVAANAFGTNTGSAPGDSSIDKATNTNVQVEGIDEGDIIKNDGRYIYIASRGYGLEPRIKIIDSQTMEVLYSAINKAPDGKEAAVNEIYVNGNVMTVVYVYKEESDNSYAAKLTTFADIYDITNKSAPKKIKSNSQDGYYLSSRMINGILYTVSSYNVYDEDDEKVKERAIPMVNGVEIGCDCIYYFDDNSVSYTVVTANDTTTLKEGSCISVLGNVKEIYCSQNTLYCLSPSYEDTYSKTEITSFSLNGLTIACKAKGEIKGLFNNNYSFDEYEGYLRCGATYHDFTTYKDVSCIYVLNDKLETVGKCENIADDEQIKSIRFMEDKGYVVTFRQTDPLFSLDLSDPKNPVVTGELKLPGYSTYLHPLSESLLLGIGYDGDEENAYTNKLKIALFDISDMAKPVLLDDFVIEGATSEVNYEPKALIHYAEKSIIGIPVIAWDYAPYTNKSVKSYVVINYTENELSEVKGFVHDASGSDEFFRGTCIDDKLYTIDLYKVIEHSLSNGEKQRECVITQESEIVKNTISETTVPAYIPETQAAS